MSEPIIRPLARIVLACIIGRYSPVSFMAGWHERVSHAYLVAMLCDHCLAWRDLSPFAPKRATLEPAVWPSPSASDQSSEGYQEGEPKSFVRAAKDRERSGE